MLWSLPEGGNRQLVKAKFEVGSIEKRRRRRRMVDKKISVAG